MVFSKTLSSFEKRQCREELAANLNDKIVLDKFWTACGSVIFSQYNYIYFGIYKSP